jgi:hydrogenase expression/formation protein HypC
MCLAVPGKVIEIQNFEDSLLRSGKVSFGGAVKNINLSFVPEVKEGDYILAHAGFALSRIDEEEASRTLDILKQMGDIE